MILGSHFLTGAILTLVLPVGLLLAVAVYWWLLLRRRNARARTGGLE